ncbi:MAG: hypothetical protein ACYCTG_00735 [Ferrimicrobium sp.]
MTYLRYGPQTPEIEAIIAKLATLTDEQAKALTAARNEAWSEASDAAYDVALSAIWSGGRHDVWVAASTDTGYWSAIWSVADDAILALMVRDLITPEQFELLYGPWTSVVEGL